MAREDITQLLRDMSRGQRDALDRLIPMVYDELREIAHRQLRNERSGHTLSTTALVHEAYLRLVNVNQVQWKDRAHFVAVAARVMRRILVDYARVISRDKRGGDAVRIPLTDVPDIAVADGGLLAFDGTLDRLQAIYRAHAPEVAARSF